VRLERRAALFLCLKLCLIPGFVIWEGMKMRISIVTVAAALIALAGCDAGSETNNSGVTAEEAAALNDTENMLDVSVEDIPASEDMSLGNEVPMDDLGADTGDLPVTDEAQNAQ